MLLPLLVEQIGLIYKRALVTGGAGFIGSHICEELLKSGIEVVAIDDISAGYIDNVKSLCEYTNFQLVNVDITNLHLLHKVLEGVDLVFHNAASKKNVCLKDPRRDLMVNALGTFNVLECAVKAQVKKFVHASTGSVYGEPQYVPQDENHPLHPISYYGVSKLAGERYVALFDKLHDLNTTILRYFHVYGSRQESNEYGGVVAIFIRNMLEGKIPTIFGSGKQERSFTYVKDVVASNLLVAIKDKETRNQVYNCASGDSITIMDLLTALQNIFGNDFIPHYEDWVIGDIKKFNIDNSKITKLGMTFNLHLTENLTETIKYYQDRFSRSM